MILPLEAIMSRTTTCVLVLILALSLDIAAQDKRAFEIADYYRTAFVGSPVISPDGELVVFTVKRYELESGTG